MDVERISRVEDAGIDVRRRRLGRWLRRGRERRPGGRGRPEPVEPATSQAPAVAPAVLARLPPDLRRQVERIQRTAQLLSDPEPGLRLLHEYLPTTLDAYLALPPGADGWMVTPDRTVRQVLAEQLEILETALDEALGRSARP